MCISYTNNSIGDGLTYICGSTFVLPSFSVLICSWLLFLFGDYVLSFFIGNDRAAHRSTMAAGDGQQSIRGLAILGGHFKYYWINSLALAVALPAVYHVFVCVSVVQM